MGYVDKADMLKSCYQISRKICKWWNRIFFHFVDVAVCNSCILFNQTNDGPKMVLKKYRLSVIAGLIGLPTEQKKGKKHHPNLLICSNQKYQLKKRYSNAGHMPSICISRRCHHCSTKENPRRTRWECSSCGVGLCMTPHKNYFKAFHAK